MGTGSIRSDSPKVQPKVVPETPQKTGLGQMKGKQVTSAKSQPLPHDKQGKHSVTGKSAKPHSLSGTVSFKAPGQTTVTSLVEKASKTRSGIQKGDAPTALQSSTLLNQVAEARRQMVMIFGSEGLIKAMTPEELSERETRTNELPAHTLPAEKMKQVSELRKMVDENLRVLNARAETVRPTVQLFSDKVRKEDLKQAKDNGLARLKTAFDGAVPELLKVKEGAKGRLKGAEARRQMSQVAWAVERLIKESPDVRFALGGKLAFSTPKERDAFLRQYVSPLRLSTSDKAKLKGLLVKVMDKAMPTEKSVVLGKQLGSGSFGTVYDATFNGRSVVVKELRRADESSLIHEMTLQGRLHDDPNVPKITGIYYNKNGCACVVMEKVDGGNTQSFFDKQEKAFANLTDRAKVALHFLSGTVSALHTMGQHGYIHRDLKPENIMFDRNTMQVRLIDYGTAGPLGNAKNNNPEGTASFMSPDHVDPTRITPQADIFSLGCTLYSELGGKLWPGYGNQWSIMIALGKGTLPGTFDDTSVWTKEMQPMRDLIEACWAKNPVDRPTTTQLMQALRGEDPQPAQDGEVGLKQDKLGALDVLKPGHALRQNPEGVLKDLLSRN